ncbi:MAG: glycine zipper 2TM domain-containing protein [Burkholderiales bacterium]
MRHSHLPRAAALTAVFAAAIGAPLAAGAAELATVISSTPVTASVPVARQVCNDGQQLVQQRPSGAGAVIGAIAGGVIGHNLGNGFGRTAATGIGAVTGAVVGDQVEAANSPVTEVPGRRCQTVSSYENRVVGYDVMYDYAGQRYSTRMARDPGRQMAVNVQPAEGGLPAPLDTYREGAPVPANEAPQTVYYAPAPQTVYYAPSPVYIAPVIGFGFGYYGGYRGRHWR